MFVGILLGVVYIQYMCERIRIEWNVVMSMSMYVLYVLDVSVGSVFITAKNQQKHH